MLVLGLVHDRPWEPPEDPWDEDESPRRRWNWRLPWRPLAWLAAWCWLMALVPIVNTAAGGLAAYGVLIAALALGAWRVERWLSRQYWPGLREHKS